MPQPTFDDIRRFCEIDDWTPRETARGKRGDHDRYTKRLDDGTILRTRASHNNDQIGDRSLWHRIWRDQLGLKNEDEFWTALKTGKPVPRAAETPEGTPEWLINHLIHTVGLTEDAALTLTRAEAEARWEAFITSRPEAREKP